MYDIVQFRLRLIATRSGAKVAFTILPHYTFAGGKPGIAPLAGFFQLCISMWYNRHVLIIGEVSWP